MSISVVEAIRSRRSVKEFSSESVDRETLEGLLEAVMLAPNHRMTEPWGFVVLGPEARRAYGVIRGNRRARAVADPAVAKSVQQSTIEAMESLPAAVVFTQRLAEDPEPGGASRPRTVPNHDQCPDYQDIRQP